MPIGSSSGVYYPDQDSYFVAQTDKEAGISIKPAQMPKQERDAAEIKENEKVGTFENRFDPAEYQPLTTSTMPLGSPTEPAGALKSSGSTETPGNEPGQELVHPTPYGLNPPEREAPFPRPRMTEMLKGFYETAKKALDLPNTPTWAMDETTGEFHTSPQAIEKAADLAGLMTFGPAPVASKMAEGTLGSFAGVRSKGFERSKLGQAQVMEANAAHPDDIWGKTGWFRG